jgi:hypothetical protein
VGARIDWIETLRAKRNQPLDAGHLRFRHEEGDAGALHCFVLDCSGSMLSGKRLALAKGMVVALFNRAYRERARWRWFASVGLRRRCGASRERRIGGTITGLRPSVAVVERHWRSAFAQRLTSCPKPRAKNLPSDVFSGFSPMAAAPKHRSVPVTQTRSWSLISRMKPCHSAVVRRLPRHGRRITCAPLT